MASCDLEKLAEWVFGEDQGSEGFSAYHALAYHGPIQCNVWNWWEWSHGCCRDVDLCYAALHKMDFKLLLLLVLNIKFGPDKDPNARFWQGQEASLELLDRIGAGAARLFQARSQHMLREFGNEVEVDSRGKQECLFQYVKNKIATENLGKHCKTAEYFSCQTCTDILTRATMQTSMPCPRDSLQE